MITQNHLIVVGYRLSRLLFGVGVLSAIATIIHIFIPFEIINWKFQRKPHNEVRYMIPVRLSVAKVTDTSIHYTDGIVSGKFANNDSAYRGTDFADSYNSNKKKVMEDTNYKKVLVVNKWIAYPGWGNAKTAQSWTGKDHFEILQKQAAEVMLEPAIENVSADVRIPVRGKTKWQNFMLSLQGFVDIFVYVFISFHLMRLLGSWRKEVRFLHNLHRKVELVGKVLVYSQLIYFMLTFVYSKYFGAIILEQARSDGSYVPSEPSVQFNPTNSANLTYFLIGVGLFVLSKLFQHGQNLEKEAALTV
jgi:hypothetical protein